MYRRSNMCACTKQTVKLAETCTRSPRGVVPWLRRLVAGLSLRISGFDPRSVHMSFVVDRVELERYKLQYCSVPCQYHFTNVPCQYHSTNVPCQYHSTNAPYSFLNLSLMLYNASNGWRRQIVRLNKTQLTTVRYLCVAVPF